MAGVAAWRADTGPRAAVVASAVVPSAHAIHMGNQTTSWAAAAAVAVAATTVAKAVYISFLVDKVIVRATVKAWIPIARGASRQWQVLPERVGNGR